MIVVGLSHPISNNNAACLVIDGKLVAMAEEERFTRIKHAPRVLAINAMKYCLDMANIKFKDVDYFAIGHDIPLSAIRNIRPGEIEIGANQARKQYLDLKKSELVLSDLFKIVEKRRIVFIRHHLAHAASSFFASGFEEANVLTLDGSGDSDSGILGYGSTSQIKIFDTISNPTSWGKAYEYITGTLGFKYNSEEGKTMGLAAYGKTNYELIPFFDWIGKNGIPLINYRKRIEFGERTPERQPNEPITQYHKDLAATMQTGLEHAVAIMSYWLYKRTGNKKLCLAGGIALNSSMNGKLLDLPWISDLFIQPASTDAGSALGAALYLNAQKTGKNPLWKMEHAYWGPEYSNDEIMKSLVSFTDLKFEKCENICESVAHLLASGKIVGWFQGRLEVGPRALGNRSILGNPSIPEMKDWINIKIKGRETWRPFAPAILDSDVSKYIERDVDSPFMIIAVPTAISTRREIISAIHVDGTARFQTVRQDTNPKFWGLLQKFKEITGISALLNTSFNLAKQPIVNTPKEAIETFARSGMDNLAIGDFLVSKL